MLERQREADRQQRNEEREMLETQRKIEREEDVKLRKLERIELRKEQIKQFEHQQQERAGAEEKIRK